MDNSPKKEKAKKSISFKALMDNNKFVLLLSVVIAFGVWVAVAMYKSPQESYTVYAVPIVVDTENSIVSQKGYKNFWQSDEKIDVTVQGPRYLITTLKAEDIIVSASLNNVDSAGVSELPLKVSLRDEHPDITISSMSKTAVEIYFDAELEKRFDVKLNADDIEEHIAQGYILTEASLTVSKITVKGPETEINKIVRVTAEPTLEEGLIHATDTFPTVLSMEGDSAAATVSVNRYVSIVEQEDFYTKISVSKIDKLAPRVEFTGEKASDPVVSFSVTELDVTIDTEFEYNDKELTVLKLDYSSLNEGRNEFNINLSDIELPEGVSLNNPDGEITVSVTY